MMIKKISYVSLVCGVLALMLPQKMEAQTVQDRVQYLIDHANEATAGGVYDLSNLIAPDLFTKQSGTIGLTNTSDNFENKRIWAYEATINRNAYSQAFSFSRTLTNMPKGHYAYGMKYFSSYYVTGSRTTKYARVSTLNADGNPYALDASEGTDLSNTPKEKNVSCDLASVKNLVFQIAAPAYKSEQASWSAFKWCFIFEYGDFSLQYTCPFYAVVKNFKTYDDRAIAELTPAQQTLYHKLVEDLRDLTLAGGLGDGSRAPEIEEAFNSALTGNIVVKNGKNKLLNKSITITNLTIEPAGRLEVAADVTVTGDMVLQGGLYNGGANYSMPDVKIESGAIAVPDGHLRLDMMVNEDRFYFISLPEDMPQSAITTSTGEEPFIYYYDGANRARYGKQNNWKQHTSDLLANHGYIIALEGAGINTITFPLSSSLVASTPADASVDVVAYGCTDGTPNAGVHIYNVGWNLIGTSFLSRYQAQSGSITVGNLAEVKTHKYITIPHPLDNGYTQTIITGEAAAIQPFSPIFVQVATGTEMHFAASALTSAAPTRMMAESEAEEMLAEITLTAPDGTSDHTGVLLSTEATSAYNVGLDLQKMYGSDQPTLCYTLLGSDAMAYHALPFEQAENIPLAYKASQAGEYTFALQQDMSDMFEHVYLNDSQENRTIDLLDDTYTFTTSAQTNTSRFYLSLVCEQTEIATTLDRVDNTGVWLSTQGRMLTVNGLTEPALVTAYDASGRLVESRQATASVQFTLPQEGVYLVRVQTASSSSSFKAIVR